MNSENPTNIKLFSTAPGSLRIGNLEPFQVFHHFAGNDIDDGIISFSGSNVTNKSLEDKDVKSILAIGDMSKDKMSISVTKKVNGEPVSEIIDDVMSVVMEFTGRDKADQLLCTLIANSGSLTSIMKEIDYPASDEIFIEMEEKSDSK